MKKSIVSFNPHKTALTVAVIFALLSVVMLIPMFLIFAASGQGGPIGMILFIAPLFYFVFGYVFTGLGALIYNVVAKRTGGIQVEVQTDVEQDS